MYVYSQHLLVGSSYEEIVVENTGTVYSVN